jgi:hypothetical protein
MRINESLQTTEKFSVYSWFIKMIASSKTTEIPIALERWVIIKIGVVNKLFINTHEFYGVLF